MSHERAPVSQEPPPLSQPSLLHAAVFGIKLQAPTLGLPGEGRGGGPSFFLSVLD